MNKPADFATRAVRSSLEGHGSDISDITSDEGSADLPSAETLLAQKEVWISEN
jgi:hypothetical protein